jgi:predicted GTPase
VLLLLLLLLLLCSFQIKDLQATITAVPCDAVLVGTPHDITRLIAVLQPLVVVTYRVTELDQAQQAEILGSMGLGAGIGKTLAGQLAEMWA